MPVRRGTTNKNVNGNSTDRRRRREWLVETFRANVDAEVVEERILGALVVQLCAPVAFGTALPACRCYRCGVLMTAEGVTVDRIVPGCQGGTYRRNNIRPACARCNSETGGVLGASRRAS